MDKTANAAGFAQFYGVGLGYKDAFVQQGSTFTLTWKVTNAVGVPLANQAVTLLANKGYSASNATFTVGATTVPNNTGAADGAAIAGITDANGRVSFAVKDTSAHAEPASTPVNNIDSLIAQTGAVFGQFALRVGAITQNLQSMDLIDVHVIAAAAPVDTLTIGALLWSDEFTGAAGSPVGAAQWTARYCGQAASNGGGTCWNDESQYYLPEAVALDGAGHAVITATKIVSPPATGTCLGSTCAFTSGRFDTQGKASFQYGYIEARIKMPTGSGN